MSVRIIDAVFRYSQSKAAARLVLLALADVAADSGEVTAYKRSQPILAAKANVDEGTVRRSITKLEELGELVVLNRGDGRRSSDYLITVGPVEGVHPDPPQIARPGGAGCTPSPGETRAQGAQDARPIIPSLSVPAPSSPGAAAPRGTRSLLPPDWQVTDEMRAWAAEHTPGVDVDVQAELFADHWRSKGERRADWNATWRNWLRRAPGYARRGRPVPPGRPTAPRQATGGGRLDL